MSPWFRRCAALGAILLSAAADPSPLTLVEAQSLALSRNPRLSASAQQIAAARAREVQAGALPNPNVTLLVDQVPIPNPGAGNFLAGVSQPLLLSGQHAARLAVAKLNTTIAEFDDRILRRDIAAQVRDAWVRLRLADERLHAARLALAGTQALLRSSEARYRAGEIARIETLQAAVEAGRAEREVSAAEGRRSQALGRLNVLIGRPAQTLLVQASDTAALPATLPPLDALIARSMDARIERQRAALLVQREALQQQAARSAIWTGTEISVQAGAVSGQPGFSSSLTVPMPFYRQQGEVAEAEADRLRAEAEQQVLTNEITLDVQEAYGEAISALRLVQTFAKSYLPLADRLVTNAERRFHVGEGSGFEATEARRAWRETQAAYQQALLEFQQALAKLERAVGQDLQATNQETQR